jgi:pyrroline-5-carboxylate reductase
MSQAQSSQAQSSQAQSGGTQSSEAHLSRLLFIGGGRMGAALASGLVRAGWAPGSIAIAEKDSARRNVVSEQLPGVSVGAGPFEARAVVLAVKPADAERACEMAVLSGATRVLSIMAGVTTRALDSWLTNGPAVMRAMPNTPALVGAGASALAGGPRASENDLAWAESVLASVGTVVRVDEGSLDAVTGLSGSGPAYVFRVVEALALAGEAAGLPRETSRALARQTVVGAGRLLADSDEEPETLRAQVTSPGGTTEAGLAVLESDGLLEVFADAVEAATRRSAELGEGREALGEGRGARRRVRER